MNITKTGGPIKIEKQIELSELIELNGGASCPDVAPNSNGNEVVNARFVQSLMQKVPSLNSAGGLSIKYTALTTLDAARNCIYLLDRTKRVNLPEAQNGDVLGLVDYFGIFHAEPCLLKPFGSDTIMSQEDLELKSKNIALELIYYGGKWVIYNLENFEEILPTTDSLKTDHIRNNCCIKTEGEIIKLDSDFTTKYFPVVVNNTIYETSSNTPLELNISDRKDGLYYLGVDWNNDNPVLTVFNLAIPVSDVGIYRTVQQSVLLGIIKISNNLVEDIPSKRHIYNFFNKKQKSLYINTESDVLGDIDQDLHLYLEDHFIEFISEELLIFQGSLTHSNNSEAVITDLNFNPIKSMAGKNHTINTSNNITTTTISGGIECNGFHSITLAIKANESNFYDNYLGCLNYYA